MKRRLVSTRRRVPADRLGPYRAGWERLAAAVGERGGRAWIFRSAEDDPLYIEFLEFTGGADPRADETVAEASRALDRLAGRGDSDEWTDAWPDDGNGGEGEPNAGS